VSTAPGVPSEPILSVAAASEPDASADDVSLRRARRALRHEVFDHLPSEAELERIDVTPEDAAPPKAGSRPQQVLRDAQGRRYLFKVAPPEHIAAELLAYRVRRLGRRLHVPAARRRLELPGMPPATGLLQPLVPVTGALSKDPRQWSELQREAMLREHPWEWLLANLDTHVDQYVLMGEHGVPVNIDWDHSLLDLPVTALNRFNRRSATVAPVRNLLYAEYVQGRVDLDFGGQRWQVRRVGDLREDRLQALVQRYCDELALPPARSREVVEAVLERQRRIVDDFEAFRRSLRRERRAVAGQGPKRPMLERAGAKLQDVWQRFVVLVLHDRLVRPGLLAYRFVLSGLKRFIRH